MVYRIRWSVETNTDSKIQIPISKIAGEYWEVRDER